jgi:hypothetical protein
MKYCDYIDHEIRRKDKRFYLRIKVWRRGQSALLTIRSHKNGKGKRYASTKVGDSKIPFELQAGIDRLAKKFGRFDIVTLRPSSEFILWESTE